MQSKWQMNLVFLAQLIIIASLDMSDPYWPLIIQHTNHILPSKQLQYWSAAIYMVPFLITILATPFWSHLGERIGQKKMLLRACGALLLTQLLLCFVSNPVLVLGVRSLQGIFAGFSAAAQAWSITMSSVESHSYVISRLQASTAIGKIIGPVAGGFVANYFGYHAIFSVSTIIFGLVVMTLMSQLQETQHKHHDSNVRQHTNVWSGLDNGIVYLLSMICFTQAARWMSAPFFALYVSQSLGGSSLMVGLLYSGIGLTMFLSGPRWGGLIDKKIQNYQLVKLIFVVTLLMAGFSQYLFAYMTNFYFVLFAAMLWGFCLSAISLIPFALLVRHSAVGQKGKMIGLGNSSSKLGNLLGVGMGAYVQAATSFTYSFVAISVLYFILAGVFIVCQLRLNPVELKTC